MRGNLQDYLDVFMDVSGAREDLKNLWKEDPKILAMDLCEEIKKIRRMGQTECEFCGARFPEKDKKKDKRQLRRFCNPKCARLYVVGPRSDRFWKFVDKTSSSGPDGECWVWIGLKDRKGYGLFTINYKSVFSHRVSYADNIGPIPTGMLVCHKCDNPGCVRPDHLFIGTDADNMSDKTLKGRQAKGIAAGSSKLNDDKIRDILVSKNDAETIAKQYSVSATTIRMIKRRKTWKHVDV